MASGTARRDDLADLFTDDLLGMSAGVGNERDEETVREAIGRGISLGDEHHGRGGGSHDDARVTPGRTRDRDGPSQQRGTPGGGRHRDRDDDRGRYMAHNAGAHTISDFLTTSLNAPAGDAPDGDSGDGNGDGDDPDHDHDPDHPDDLDGDDEIEARPWPSPAELLADARELLATADSLVLREGGEAPSAEKMRRLDRELRRIVDSQRTTPEDDQKRQNLLARFDTMLQRKFAGVTLQPFGSFVSVFHTAGSDVDVSLEVSPNSNWYDPREMGPGAVNAAVGGGRGGRNRRQQTPRGYKSRKVQLLSKVASELRYQKFADVNLIGVKVRLGAHLSRSLVEVFRVGDTKDGEGELDALLAAAGILRDGSECGGLALVVLLDDVRGLEGTVAERRAELLGEGDDVGGGALHVHAEDADVRGDGFAHGVLVNLVGGDAREDEAAH